MGLSLEYTALTLGVDPDKGTDAGIFFLFSEFKYVLLDIGLGLVE